MKTITLTNITKTFRTDRGAVRAADDITLTIPAGDITAIIGESGCGKTTLLRLISGLETPDSGAVTLSDNAGHDGAAQIAVVFQEPRLFPWLSVRQNAELAVRNLPESEKQQRVRQALEMTGLADVADAYPEELSGGMAQRAGFARALALRPEVLLLDEAFSALDALTRRRVRDEFLKIHERHPMTTVLVTHDILEASLMATDIVRLKAGRIEKTYRITATRPRTIATPGVSELAHTIETDFFN